MTHHEHHHHHHYRRGFRGRRRFPNREEWLKRLEEYQRDLEQEVADVADLIRRLREEQGATEAEATV
jgi:hypothetical protein